ncbi:MAG TPA: SDR family oxidoreductase [Desertimonas sp.]|nr:SDR family oxidoreductase [Desertimonas sp.]
MTDGGVTSSVLAGRTAIVSGASRGIGAAIARSLDVAGARVALLARSKDKLDEVAATLANDPVIVVADLGTVEGPAAAAEQAIAAFDGRVDVLVNNAGAALRKPSDELTADEIQQILDVNVRGVLLLTVAVLPAMLAAGSGSIVSLSSISARRGTPRRAVYAASKAAIDGMTRGLAMEYGPRGIRANAVAPGVVPTDLWVEHLAKPGVADEVLATIPTRRLTDAEEVADVVTFLASDASRSITGETISTDGGMYATLNIYPTV